MKLSKLAAAFAVLFLCGVLLAQTGASPITNPHVTFVNSNGQPCWGCTFISYAAGSSTPLATYKDENHTIANQNPLSLGATGGADVWMLANTAYRLRLVDANNAVVWDIDNITAGGGGGSGLPSGTGLVAVTAGVGGLATPNTILTQAALIPGVAGPNYFFGDSLVADNGSGDAGTSKQMANRLSNDMLGQKYMFALSGTYEAAINAQVFTYFPVNYNTFANLPKVFIDGGTNDAINETVTTGSINNYTLEYNAMIAWMNVPLVNKVYATTATATGTWTTLNQFPLDASNVGGEKQSTTNASTLTFSIPASGTRSGIYYGIPSAANGGTFTYSIDGTLQTDVCSGTTTFSSTGCNGVAVVGGLPIFRQDFPVTAGTHTGVVTVTSATSGSNIVYILGVDVTPTSFTGQPIVMASGVLKEYLDANSATFAAFDTAQAAVMSSVSSWAAAYRVDVRGGTPGVNSTTDMQTGLAGCPGGLPPQHPNSCGYSHYVQTTENMAAANGLNIFYPGLGVNPSITTGALQVGGIVTSGSVPTRLGAFQVGTQAVGTSINAANPNIFNTGVPTATSFAQPACFFSTATFTVCTGFTYDAVRSQVAMALISQYEMGFQHCTGGLTGGPTGCRWDLWSDPTTGLITSTISGTTLGTAIASAATIAPLTNMTHITGTAAITTITPITTGYRGCVKLIPDAAWTLATGGNIIQASTAVVNKIMDVCYDGTNWYPSY